MAKVKKRKSRLGTILYVIFLVLWIAALGVGTYFLWKDRKSVV